MLWKLSSISILDHSQNSKLSSYTKRHADCTVLSETVGEKTPNKNKIKNCSLLLGETLAVVAKINNASSKDMAPKFSLIQNVVYRAQGHTKSENRVIFKQADPTMKPNTEKTVNCAVKIPSDVVPTIQNCDIISLEYHLKVCNSIIVYGHNLP